MKLQKAPQALLGALDLKVSGQNPDELSDELRATFSVDEFYLSTLQVPQRVVDNAATTNSLLTMTVPNGELWRVQSMGFYAQLDAADVAADTHFEFFARINTIGVHLLTVTSEGFNNASRTGALWLNRPLFLPPAATLNLQLLWTATNPYAVAFDALINRIPL